MNRYRFEAHKGQRLVISAEARRLIPYHGRRRSRLVPGRAGLYDAHGQEVAYDDDFRFNPDPTSSTKCPRTASTCWRSTMPFTAAAKTSSIASRIGELPFVTSIFPLGGRAGEPRTSSMKGWNLEAG